MKKFIATSLFTLILSITAWSQIPDPAYIPSDYQDTSQVVESTDIIKNSDVQLGNKPQTKANLQPKLFIGFGNFNFRGDISDNRSSGIIGQSGFQIGLSANLNEYIDASLIMEEGTVRVDGVFQDELPLNFMSTINTIGLRFNYNFKNVFKNKLLTPYVGLGLSFLKFDSKGSNDDTNDEYEIDLLSEWLISQSLQYTGENIEPYSQKGIDIPISLGLNLKVNDRLNINIGATYHYTNTDFIDNIENGSSDKYIVNSANLVYDLYCYNCEEDYIPEVHDNYIVDFDELDREDEDNDGIVDIDDFCIGTPRGVKVDAVGCPIDTDNDNVADYLDKEANTPKGAVVNSQGIQLTDKMSEAIYLKFLNSASRKDAYSYFEEEYPTDKFIKLTKKVVNVQGDTLMVDIYKPRVFQQIYNQQKEFEDAVTPAQYVNLESDKIYKLQIAKHDKGIDASEINRLMSIINIKSTIEEGNTVYYTGEYDDMLKARQKQKQLINSGYKDVYVVEDEQGDLRTISNDEMDREKNKRASAKLEELPPLEDIVFRVQLDVLKEVDLDFYDLDELVVFEDNEGFKHVFTEGYASYEEALARRNELYFMSYENAKVVAIKEGKIVEAKDYMDLAYTEDKTVVYGDVIFKIQLGIYSKNDVVELAKLNDLKGVEKKEVSDDIHQYTIGTYTNIQGAMLKLDKLLKQGYDGSYLIAFYNEEQISIKKAKELKGF